MPYIDQTLRKKICLHGFDGTSFPCTAGELNYLFTSLCLEYLKDHKESYKTYNDIIGALENCKLELYRRKIAPYEEKKLKEHGDVY